MRRMTDKKTLILFSIIYVVVFAVMNMLVFFVFNEKNNVFWISYGFMCAAFVIQIVSMFLAVKALEVEAVFLEYHWYRSHYSTFLPQYLYQRYL